MRVSATLMAAAMFVAPAFAEKETKGPVYEPNTYRFGGTYTVVASQSASQCAAACGRDANCMAWSFVDLPGGSSQNACELKSTIGKAETNPTSISGISPEVERMYQPSPFNTRTLANGRTFTAPTSRRLYGGERPAPSAPASISSMAPRTYSAPSAPATVTSRAPTYRAAPAAPASITSTPPVKMAAPAAPATITSKSPLYKTPPAAPATITTKAPVKKAAPAAPAVITSSTPVKVAAPVAPATITSTPKTKVAAPAAPAVITSAATSTSKAATPTPVKVAAQPVATSKPAALTTTPSVPTAKPAPSVEFTPLKARADGTYKQTMPAPTPANSTSRIVLTGPTGDDVDKAVHGRVVLTGEMASTSSGGVGETPAAPIPRNVPVNTEGERVPYKDISSRDYPDYSVTRAAQDGIVERVGSEDPGLGTTPPVSGS